MHIKLVVLLLFFSYNLFGQSLNFNKPVYYADLELNTKIKSYKSYKIFNDISDTLLIEIVDFYDSGLIKNRIFKKARTNIVTKRKKKELVVENVWIDTFYYDKKEDNWLIISNSNHVDYIKITDSMQISQVFIWCDSIDAVFNDKECGLRIDYHYNKYNLIDSVVTYEKVDSNYHVNHRYIFTYQDDTLLVGDTLKSFDPGWNHYSYYKYEEDGSYKIHSINRPNGISTIFPKTYNKLGLVIEDMNYTYEYEYDKFGNWIEKKANNYKEQIYKLIRIIEYN